MAGYLDDLAQGLRLGGGVLNPQVQQFNQQDDMAATNAIRQRQQFMLQQAIAGAREGSVDPAQAAQLAQQMGIQLPAGLIGPSPEAQARADALRRRQAFEQNFDPNAPEEDQIKLAMQYGTPEQVTQFIGQRESRKSREMIAEENRQRQREALAANLAQERRHAEMTHEVRMSNARTAEQRAAEAARHNAAIEALNRAIQQNRPQPAPSIRDIIDPTDQTRMISVDTRTYQPGTGLGSTGVIGIAGKEPSAAKREEQFSSGRQTVSNLVANLSSYYDQLEKSGDIGSTKQGPIENVMAGIQSSGVGQSVGRMLGTESQSMRNSIAQQRPVLLQAIKQATGMSAKQMDSNVELKLYLGMATDPTLDVQANRRALEMLDKLYGIGGVAGMPPPDNGRNSSDVPPPGAVRPKK